MSKRPPSGDGYRVEDAFNQLLEGAAKLLMWGGLIVAAITTTFLIIAFFTFSSPNPGASPDQAATNIAIFQKILVAGLVSLGVGSAFIFWGEEVLAPLQLMGAALFYFAPLFVPMFAGQGGGVSSPVAANALGAVQSGGIWFGFVALAVLVLDISQRMRLRALYGAKADALKFGKHVNKEYDFQNVFMGKCWQLPYCRKFVRERCPVFHAKTTCWKERVGCMCEEDVIRGAMEGRPAPKSMEEAVRMIPYNKVLPVEALAERCRACVIYNEHQKHKYKLAVPVLMAIFIGLVVLFRASLLGAMESVISKIDQMIGVATYRQGTQIVSQNVPLAFQIALLACVMVVVLTYCLRFLEFLIFKAKI